MRPEVEVAQPLSITSTSGSNEDFESVGAQRKRLRFKIPKFAEKKCANLAKKNTGALLRESDSVIYTTMKRAALHVTINAVCCAKVKCKEDQQDGISAALGRDDGASGGSDASGGGSGDGRGPAAVSGTSTSDDSDG